MTPLGSHLAADPALHPFERAYMRLVGAPEPALRVRTAHVLREVRRARPRRVVDVGAGAGFMAIAAARQLPQATVVALEPQAEQAHRAEQLAAAAGVRNLRVVCADALDHEERDVDVVTCVDALEYVGDDSLLLTRIAAWLRPGGTLVLHCRRVPTAYRLARFRSGDRFADGRLREGYDAPGLRAGLETAGFSVRRIRVTLAAPAELAYELVDPERGPLASRGARAVVAPLLPLVTQLDRLPARDGAGLLAIAVRS
jgi:cyclopropane fatty-acyl-phospholipid synthase-like methyltransferase